MKTDSLQKLAFDALEDLKGIDIVTINVKELTSITDVMLICTGRSIRHVKSLAENIVKDAKKHQIPYIRMEGQEQGEWVIVDLGDVVAHIMLAETRTLYNLEDLWEIHANTRARHRE